MTDTISHWIDGKPQDGQSGRTGPVFDPATGRERARVAFASAEEVDKAVAVAKNAFKDWEIVYSGERIVVDDRNELVKMKDQLIACKPLKRPAEKKG